MKRTIVGYGNCQVGNIVRMLGQHPEFAAQYDVAGAILLQNFSMIQCQLPIPYETIASADLIIYQPTSDEHGVYATSQLLTHCKPDCIRLSFPYIYNYAFWEVLVFADGDTKVGHSARRYAHLNHQPITRLKEQGLSFDAIAQKILARDMDWDFGRRYAETQAILRAKEADCTAKVADFIDAHHRTTLLFYTQNHPTAAVLLHVVRQFLQTLGYDPTLLPTGLRADYAPKTEVPNFPIGWFAWKHYGFTFVKEPDASSFPFLLHFAREIYEGRCSELR